MKDKIEGAFTLSACGFNIWDIYEEKSSVNTITYEDNRVDKISTGVDYGIGVRGIKDAKTYYGYTNDMSSLEDVISTVCSGSKNKKEDISFSRLRPVFSNQIRIQPDSVMTEQKISLLKKINDRARSISPLVKQVTVNYMEKKQSVELVNDLGDFVKDTRTYSTVAIMIIAGKNGRIETGYTVLSGHTGYELFQDADVNRKTDEAAGLAIRLLDADKKITGEMTAVISCSAGGTMIHEAVGHSLEADLVQKGLSQYAGKMGQKVASGIITVIDDATIPNKRGSFSFDDEGVMSQKTVLIEKGVLKSYMYDRETALRDKAAPTGNGRRESYKWKPIPRMRNTMISPGEGSAEDLIRDTRNGIFVVKMGGGQVNTVTGEFVFEVKDGYMIEDGKIASPVRGATLMGTGTDVLNTIDGVCSDLGFDAGTCGKDGQGVPVGDAQPTLRIPKILVGSK
jgi:TldD protein